MDYEKKLKLAKEALDSGSYDKETIEYLFPELAENEDEKIRKDLIEWIDDFPDTIWRGHNKRDILTWLEKQGKETSWKPSKEEMDVLYGLAYITNQYDEYKEEVITRLYQDLKREFFNGSSYENMFPNTEDSVRRRSIIQVLEYARSLDTYNQYGKADIDKNIAWLEKQGEPKEYTFKSIPRLLDMIEPTERAKAYSKKLIKTLTEEGYITDAKIVEDCLKQMNGEVVAMAIMDEKQGEDTVWTDNDYDKVKSIEYLLHELDNHNFDDWFNSLIPPYKEKEAESINKVEPKFKVGDWITIK